jgi:hypothetical protein
VAGELAVKLDGDFAAAMTSRRTGNDARHWDASERGHEGRPHRSWQRRSGTP